VVVERCGAQTFYPKAILHSRFLQSMGMLMSLLVRLQYCLALVAAWDVGQPVQTTSGTVKGHASSWKREVSEYLGIRFAKAATGSLRFAPPVRYNGTGEISGAKYVRT
jgi:carboxylesterase family protein